VTTDFTDFSDLIPDGTIAIVQLGVRSGDANDGLKRTKDGTGEGIDAEITIVEGPYARRKFFAFMLVAGSSDGQRQMSDRNKAMLKKIVDSARFLEPGDKSPEARAKRTMAWRDFDAIRFLAEIGIETGKSGYPDKNIISKVITKDRPEWNGRPPIEQNPQAFGLASGTAANAPVSPAGAAAPAPIAKPNWAK
jgi:hypothetical protein